MYPDLMNDLKIKNLVCDVCERAKHRRSSYASNTSDRRQIPFQIIHYNLWGPAPSTDIHGFKWFLILLDDFSRLSWIYLLKNKSEVTIKIKNFTQIIHRQYEKQVKAFRTDNAKDFCNAELQQFFL